MMNTLVIGATFCTLAALVFAPPSLFANAGYAGKEGKSCIYCHNKVTGGGGLNGNGAKYLSNGHKFEEKEDKDKEKEDQNDKDKEKEPASGGSGGGSASGSSSSYRPDTPQEIAERKRIREEAWKAMQEAAKREGKSLYERFTQKGRKIFTTTIAKLSGNGKCCVDCHIARDLSRKAPDYPKYNKDLNKVVTFDTAIRYCILSKMDGPKLKPGSSVPVAVAAYLKEVSKGSMK